MEQRSNTNQAASNEENVRSAIEDVALIKRIINRSEINMQRLGWLFLVYGIVTFAYAIIKAVFTIILTRFSSIQTVVIYNYVLQGVSLAVMITLFILFIIKRERIVRSESIYTMKLFDMWGIMMFAPVLLGVFPVIFNILAADFGLSQYTVLIYRAVFDVMKYSAVCMCIFFTGHYIASWPLRTLSLGMFLMLPIICAFGSPLIESQSMTEPNEIMQFYSYFTMRTSESSVILTIVYIILGIIFLAKQRDSAYGNE